MKRLNILKDTQVENKFVKATKIEMDSIDFGIEPQILYDLNIHKHKLISSTKETKRVGIISYSLEIVDYVSY
ncbi:hypothetical protein [Psychroserpens sp.]